MGAGTLHHAGGMAYKGNWTILEQPTNPRVADDVAMTCLREKKNLLHHQPSCQRKDKALLREKRDQLIIIIIIIMVY